MKGNQNLFEKLGVVNKDIFGSSDLSQNGCAIGSSNLFLVFYTYQKDPSRSESFPALSVYVAETQIGPTRGEIGGFPSRGPTRGPTDHRQREEKPTKETGETQSSSHIHLSRAYGLSKAGKKEGPVQYPLTGC